MSDAITHTESTTEKADNSNEMNGPQPTKTARPTQMAGVPGFMLAGGIVQSRERDSTLRGLRRFETFNNNLLNVAIVGAAVRYFLDLAGNGAEWAVAPADEGDAAAVDAAEFVQNVFDDLEETPFSTVMKRAATFRFHGFSIAEWAVCSREDGRIGFSEIENRPQHTIEEWHLDSRSTVVGAWQRDPANGKMLYLPRNKILYLVDDTLEASPEGVGLYRHIARGADGIRRFEDLEHYGFETDLRGVPVGRAPLGELARMVEDGVITAAEAAAAREVLRGFIENHVRGPKTGLMLDSATYTTEDDKQTPSAVRQWDVELLKAGGVSHESIGKAIRRKTFEIARLLGAEFLLLGEDGSGSLALADEAKERIYHMVNSTRKEMGHAQTSQLIARICDLNNIPRAIRPVAAPAKVEKRKVGDVVDSLAKMAQAGAPIMPDDPAVNEVRDMLGLSRVEATAMELDALLQSGNGNNGDDIGDVKQGNGGGANGNDSFAEALGKLKGSLAELEQCVAA